MNSPLSRSTCVLSLLFFCGGCSSTSDTLPAKGGPPVPDAGAVPTDVHGTFHFIVDKNGAPTEVTTFVYTDPFEVRLDGLPAGASVDLTTSAYDPSTKGQGYVSKVTFVADGSGAIDTKTMAPTAGTYSGVDPDGIIWSAIAGPLAEGLGPDRASAFFHAEIAGTPVADGVLGRTLTSADVKETTVTDNGLVAVYFAPAGVTDKVPIVAFGGSEGGIGSGESYAARFASWGYPSLGVAYFGTTGVPAELKEIPLEYFQKAFAWLDTQPETRKGKAVVVGGSRGGELALLLGATFPNVAGVVAETPSSYRWGAISNDIASAWSYQGKPLAYVPDVSSLTLPPTVKTPDGQDAWVSEPGFETDLTQASPDALEAARNVVEATQGPILMVGGDSDQLWPACDFISRAMSKLTAAGHVAKYADEGICYPNAGHAVGEVGLPTTGSMWATLGTDTFSLGGTAAGNAQSGRPVEAKIRALLTRVSQ